MEKKILDSINSSKYLEIDLNPGELYIAKEPRLFRTVLGSCIAVIFYCKRLKTGAICHAQLPEEKRSKYKCSDFCPRPCDRNSPDSNEFKYVACSIRYVYECFHEMGISNDEIDVKLIGGANILSPVHIKKTLGEENINTAEKLLKKYKLKIINQDTGGNKGRALSFYSDTGEVLIKKRKCLLNN